MELVGWLGGLTLASCAIPQALECVWKGSAAGLSVAFLVLWSVGEVLTFAYVLPKADGPLIANYAVNIVALSVIWRYRLWPRGPTP